ncbi:NAD(P)-binding protein [Anaeromyces robustus]|uniref:NAD(P)-binding protein n=1 Tax=Anaeromyces robustus TaxID=1754192 RepID=A0A1Y1XIY1_9FUNG|nr:NAD(P)-binding protein [Anaeromyces robustus]|eukprot:ORX85346.1 NAD(P)-binding protein [Anaeromyces robustus]
MASKDPVYIITGASKGIGLEALKYFVTIPCNIITVSRSIPEELSKILDAHKNIYHFCGNVSDTEISDIIIETVEKLGGKINAIVHNVGVAPILKIQDTPVEVWKRVFDINFFSMVDLTQKALPFLRNAKGRVLFVSSGVAVKGKQGWSAYSCSKASINMFAQVLADEEPDVFTLAIRPGVVNTSMQEYIREQMKNGFSKEDIELFENYNKEKKLKDPKEPASVLFNLATKEKLPEKCTSGEFISIDDERLASYKTFKSQ